MIWITGDTHGDFDRFQYSMFPEQSDMTRDDYVIICGDFGGIWDNSKKERRRLDWLEQLPFTLLFLDGNHENYDLLSKFPVEGWNGGKVQFIRPHVIHLLRGQVYELQGYSFFTMGGAQSHDIEDGILNPWSPDYDEQFWTLRQLGAKFRVHHRSWWKQELPSKEEYEEARRNLDAVNWKVDYIVTHCACESVQKELGKEEYGVNLLTSFLEELNRKAKFHYWLFGHYHGNRAVGEKHILLYKQMVQVV